MMMLINIPYGTVNGSEGRMVIGVQPRLELRSEHQVHEEKMNEA
jgi:hypothetical protein